MRLPTQQTQVSIRQAVIADADALHALRLEAFGSDYDREVSRPVTFWSERLSSQTDSAVFVAENSTGLVGMTGVYYDELLMARQLPSTQPD